MHYISLVLPSLQCRSLFNADPSLMKIPLILYAIPSLYLTLSPLDIEETFPLTYLNLSLQVPMASIGLV